MAFWSSERILEEQPKQILVGDEFHHLIDEEHFKPSRIKSGKYELTLSREVIVTPDGTDDHPEPGEGPTLTIPSGQYAILYTEERITVPNHAIALISIKFGFTYKGLVNISGFHVDPGFSGHLKFSVYNAGNHPIYLDYGRECFQIWFADLGPTRDVYKGTHDNQARITTDDRAQMSDRRHSPATLNDRINDLERKISIIAAVGLVVVVPLLIGFATAIFDHWIGHQNDLALKAEWIAISFAILFVCLALGLIAVIFYAIYENNKGPIKKACRWVKKKIEETQRDK